MLRRSRFERFLILSAVLTFTGFAIAGYVADQNKRSGVASEATQATQATQASITTIAR